MNGTNDILNAIHTAQSAPRIAAERTDGSVVYYQDTPENLRIALAAGEKVIGVGYK